MPSDLTPPRGAAPLMRALASLSLTIAFAVGLGLPLAWLGWGWQAQVQQAALVARLHGAAIARDIDLAADSWRGDVAGRLDAGAVPLEARCIVGLDGAVVARSGSEPSWPRAVARAPLQGRNGLVGHVVVARSLQPLLHETAGVALAAALLGLLLHRALRTLRRRALGRSLSLLAGEQAQRRHDLEEVVHALFDRSADGIVTIDGAGRVRSCNPRAAAMFGLLPAQVLGLPLADFVDAPGAGGRFPEGSCETSARCLEAGVPISYPCEVATRPLGGADDGALCTLRDLSERRAAEQRMARLASYDSLTGLPNRSLFRDRLAQAMHRADRSGRRVALMVLDLDRFKTINDSLGHTAGDQLLQHVAQAITESLRATDTIGRGAFDAEFTVARLGGDEFTVIAEDLRGPEQASQLALRIRHALERPFLAGGQEVVVTTSVGITLYPDDACPLDELLTHADMAMYRAKELGRDGCQFYSAQMHAAADQRLQLEAALRHALERGEFVLVYQPKAQLASGRVSGVEALLRWRRADGSIATPDQFIGVLEETGLILPVGAWVLEQAARQVQQWHRLGLPALRLAVNLSARQLRHGDIVETVAGVLARTRLAPGLLELELTESMLMDGDATVHTLHRLSALGVQLAIDDFGTGYSSLSYLKRFSVDTLKIDRSFVRDTPADPEASAIVAAIIAFGRSLSLRVVAEGVETEAQQRLLERAGCDEMQGYLLSRPLAPEAFVAWLGERGYDCPTTDAVASSSSNSASAACPLIA